MLAIPLHVPGSDIGMVERDIDRREGQAEQSIGAIETRLDHPLELEVWLEFRFVEIMVTGAQSLGIEMPIPSLQRAIDPVIVHQTLESFCIARRRRLCRSPDRHQQFTHGFGRTRHFGFKSKFSVVVVT